MSSSRWRLLRGTLETLWGKTYTVSTVPNAIKRLSTKEEAQYQRNQRTLIVPIFGINEIMAQLRLDSIKLFPSFHVEIYDER